MQLFVIGLETKDFSQTKEKTSAALAGSEIEIKSACPGRI